MDAMDFGFDEEDDLSSALGTETLAARDMVPEGFDNAPRAHVPTRYYPIRKVVYYQAIHRPAGLLGSLSALTSFGGRQEQASIRRELGVPMVLCSER
jgi:hypothetical protein